MQISLHEIPKSFFWEKLEKNISQYFTQHALALKR